MPNIGNGKWINVGRLDYNTEGLMLFTNSGELANRLMHPRYEVEREYAVRIMGRLADEQMLALTTGVELEDGPAKCEKVEDGGGEDEGANHWYHVVLKEGRNREVRRLFEALGLTVSRLIRTRYGTLAMPSVMKRGDQLELEPAEVAAVLDSAGLKSQGGPQGQSRPGGGKPNRGRHQGGRQQGQPGQQRQPGQKDNPASIDSRGNKGSKDSRDNPGSLANRVNNVNKVNSGIRGNRADKIWIPMRHRCRMATWNYRRVSNVSPVSHVSLDSLVSVRKASMADDRAAKAARGPKVLLGKAWVSAMDRDRVQVRASVHRGLAPISTISSRTAMRTLRHLPAIEWAFPAAIAADRAEVRRVRAVSPIVETEVDREAVLEVVKVMASSVASSTARIAARAAGRWRTRRRQRSAPQWAAARRGQRQCRASGSRRQSGAARRSQWQHRIAQPGGAARRRRLIGSVGEQRAAAAALICL